MIKPHHLLVSLIVLLPLMFGCGMGSGPENVVKNKLEIILREDLRYMESEISHTEVSNTAHFTITEFEHFPEKKYSYNAVVEFYYFKNIQMKQIRKYRYSAYDKKWERYFKEYKNM